MRLSIISVAGGLLLPEQVCILQQDAKVYWMFFFVRLNRRNFLYCHVCQFFLQFRNPQDAYN